jgi:hypothetical protein
VLLYHSKKVKEHPKFSQDFVNQRYWQNNASYKAKIAHTHIADPGLGCNDFVCCTCNSGVCDKELKNAHKWTNVTVFLLPQYFCHNKFLQNDALQGKH